MNGDKHYWPIEIRLNPEKDALRVGFDDNSEFTFSAEFLRVHSPSAEVKGHGAEERRILGGKSKVTITTVEPVGNYAVRLIFSDGHSTGIYSWSYLHEIGLDQPVLWKRYLDDLTRLGLQR
jgi:DUF971 family protein